MTISSNFAIVVVVTSSLVTFVLTWEIKVPPGGICNWREAECGGGSVCQTVRKHCSRLCTCPNGKIVVARGRHMTCSDELCFGYDVIFNSPTPWCYWHCNKQEKQKCESEFWFCRCVRLSSHAAISIAPPTTTECPTATTTEAVIKPCNLTIGNGDAGKMFDQETAKLPGCSGTTCSLPPDHKGYVRPDNTCNEDTVRIRYDGGTSCMFYETIGDGDNDNAVRGDDKGVKLSCTSTGGVLSGTLGITGGAGKVTLNDITDIRCDTVPAGNVGPSC